MIIGSEIKPLVNQLSISHISDTRESSSSVVSQTVEMNPVSDVSTKTSTIRKGTE